MYNIGIINFKETASGFASFFSSPKVEDCFSVRLGEDEFIINMITCLYSTKSRIDQKKLNQINKLCRENDIKLLVSKGKPDTRTKLYTSELCDLSSELREIKAIKLLGALIRLSQKRDENLLEKRMGFVTASVDFETIDLLSEEAAGVMVLEGAGMDEESREALHLQVMKSKGISVIFTKDVLKIIRNSDILLVDESIDFSQYTTAVKDKIILGESSSLKDSMAVSKVLLWPEPITSISPSGNITENNDELLAILRYCTKEKDYMQFLSLLPYIYLFDGYGKPQTMP